MAVRTIFNLRAEGTGRWAYGWSEVYWFLGGDDLDTAEMAAITLGNKRMALSAGNVRLISCRLSVDRAKPRRGRLIYSDQGGNPSSNLQGTGGFTGERSDLPNTCLQLRFNVETDGRFRNGFIAGIPDALITTNPAGPSYADVPTWLNKFRSYRSTLLQNSLWGYWGRGALLAGQPVGIRAWSREAASPLRIIASVDTADDIAQVGSIVHVRGVKMVGGRRVPHPSGQYRVAAESAAAGLTSYTLQSAETFDITQVLDFGTLEQVTMEYVPFVDVQVGGQSTRKRGVGSSRARGRSSGQSRRLV